MEQAQAYANRITNSERLPLVHDVVYYQYAGEAMGDPRVVAVYFQNTRIIYSREPSIAYSVLVHEMAHVVSTGRGLPDDHGPQFVETERYIFQRYKL